MGRKNINKKLSQFRTVKNGSGSRFSSLYNYFIKTDPEKKFMERNISNSCNPEIKNSNGTVTQEKKECPNNNVCKKDNETIDVDLPVRLNVNDNTRIGKCEKKREVKYSVTDASSKSNNMFDRALAAVGKNETMVVYNRGNEVKRMQELFHPVEWNNIKKNMLTLAHIPNEKLEAFLKTQKFDLKNLSKDGIINFFIENLFNNCKDLNSHYIISDSEQHKKNEVVYFNTKYIMVQLSELFKEEYHDELKEYHDELKKYHDNF